MFRISLRDLTMMAVLTCAPEIGYEFETTELDVAPARYRVLRVTDRDVELTRVGFLHETAPPKARPA